MKTVIASVVILTAAVAIAQNCIVPAPELPPKATDVLIRFPNPDGGARPCFGSASTPNGQPPKQYQMSTTDCNRLKRLGDWAVQQDNGWSDGGAP